MTHRVEYLLYAFVISMGIVLALIGIELSLRWQTVFLSVGTSIMATGIVSAVMRGFLGEPLEPLVNRMDTMIQLKDMSDRTGVVSIRGSRHDLSLEDWRNIFRNANNSINILGYAVHFLTDDPEIFSILKQKAQTHCRIRIVLGDPESPTIIERTQEEAIEGSISERIRTALARWQPLMSYDIVEIRLQSIPLYASIYQGDFTMIVTPQLYGMRAANAPALSLKFPGTLFEKYTKHFDAIWEHSQPWIPFMENPDDQT